MCTFDFRAGNNYFIVDELPPRLAKKLDEVRCSTLKLNKDFHTENVLGTTFLFQRL